MTCLRNNARGADLLIGYLEGTLTPSDLQNLNSHASQCAECRELLAVQATLDDAGFHAAAIPEVSAGFDAGVYAKISLYEAQRQTSWWRKWIPVSVDSVRDSAYLNPLRFWTAGVATAGAALAVMLLVGAPSTREQVTPAEHATSQVQPTTQAHPEDLKQASVSHDIEQLERDLDDLELLMPVTKKSNNI